MITAEEQAMFAGGPQTPASPESAPSPPRSLRSDDASSPPHLTRFRFVDYDMPRNRAGIRVLSAAEQASFSGPLAASRRPQL
eukprot:6527359-Pyramimonas_sp.AAC.1